MSPKARRKIRHAFVREYEELCREAFAGKVRRHDFRSDAGIKIVVLARARIGYNSTTWSGDIFYSIYPAFEQLTLNQNRPK